MVKKRVSGKNNRNFKKKLNSDSKKSDKIKSEKKGFFNKISRMMLANDEFFIFIIFIVIITVVAAISPQFRTLYNVKIVLRQFSLITIVAMGQALVIITGGFDLSVGAIVALCGMAGTYFAVTLHWPVGVALLMATLIGATCGVFNGFLITRIRINALIATLASGWIFQGVLLVTTKGWPISNFPPNFAFLGQGHVLGIPLPVILMVVIGIILSIFLSRTIYGRTFYAIGGNEKASTFAGIPVNKYKFTAFVICGALAGFAGIVLDARVGSAQATAGLDWTLPTVAAAVIGGVALSGGRGKIYGVIIGSALLGIINNILVLFKVSSYWQSLISGFVLILAVTADSLRKK